MSLRWQGWGGDAFSIHLNGASVNSDGLEAMMQFESGVAKMAVEMASFFPDCACSSFLVVVGVAFATAAAAVDLFPCSAEGGKKKHHSATVTRQPHWPRPAGRRVARPNSLFSFLFLFLLLPLYSLSIYTMRERESAAGIV